MARPAANDWGDIGRSTWPSRLCQRLRLCSPWCGRLGSSAVSDVYR